MSNTQAVILDGRGYALVPLPDLAEAHRLHAAGVCIRLEVDTNSAHFDRLEDFPSLYPKYCELWSCRQPKLFALFVANPIGWSCVHTQP